MFLSSGKEVLFYFNKKDLVKRIDGAGKEGEGWWKGKGPQAQMEE